MNVFRERESKKSNDNSGEKKREKFRTRNDRKETERNWVHFIWDRKKNCAVGKQNQKIATG